MKRLKKTLVLAATVALMIGTFFLPDRHVYGSENATSEIDIGIKPSRYLFHIKDMKPGDWVPRTMIVQNNGLKDFNYYIKLENTSESVKLYNELLLEISDEDGEIYSGKLADLHELPPRSLASSSEEKLGFTIRFPEHLGNEYQGLDARFTIKFTAEGEGNLTDEASSQGLVGRNGSPSGGSPLPDTATSMFTLLLIGGIFLLVGGILLLYQKLKRIGRFRV